MLEAEEAETKGAQPLQNFSVHPALCWQLSVQVRASGRDETTWEWHS